jgi:nucleotide-binding universal stress UspA family protein
MADDAPARMHLHPLSTVRPRGANLEPQRAERAVAPALFANILCGVDGSRGSAEAVRQVIALCGPETVLDFFAVTHSAGVGLSTQADLSELRAQAALDDAAWHAKRAGVTAVTSLRKGARVSDMLLAEGQEHDLLAIGCHGNTRLGGMMLGSTSTQIAHRADGPLLIARHSSDGEEFPRVILVASDGSPGSWGAVRTASRLAGARGSELRVVYVPDGHPERYRALFKQLAAIERDIGSVPAFTDVPGDPARRIVEAAEESEASLIVVGKRGLRGIRGLGSVSERIVHRARCSVLMTPPAPALASLD